MKSLIDVSIAQHALESVLALGNEKLGNRTGGFLVFFDHSSKTMSTIPLGNYEQSKEVRFLTNATEKTIRLLSNGQFRSMHTRDEQKEIWGGGIQYGSYICSFSGFLEEHDECIALIYVLYHDCKENMKMTHKQTLEYMGKFISNNNEFNNHPIHEVLSVFSSRF
jgi:hypothetical protein